MTECSMKSCVKSTATSNYQKDGISFHRFPKCAKTKQKWIDATHRDDDWSPTNESVICSTHFAEDDFQAMKNRRRLRDNSIPTFKSPETFSMDRSLRDFVIAEYRQQMILDTARSPKSSAKAAAAEKQEKKKELDKKEIDAKNKAKAKKNIRPVKKKYRAGAARSMKVIKLLANEKLKKKKRR